MTKIRIQKNSNSGFSLIEVIVYIALFSILIGTVVVSAYTIFESANRNTTEALLINEGNFLIGKINWALSGTNMLNAPAPNTSGISLSISPVDTALGNPIVFSQIGKDLKIFRGTNPGQVLNNTNVSVTNVSFTHTQVTNPPFVSDSVEIQFTLSTLTPEGRILSEDFKTIQYLRK